MSLNDDINLFHHKIRFEPSMSGTQHMTSQVLTGDERLAIDRVLDAARKQDNLTKWWRQNDFIDIVFDGPPSHISGRFVEVEDPDRKSISVGDWIERDDGHWVLRLAVKHVADK